MARIKESSVKRQLIKSLNKLAKSHPLWHAPWSDRYTSGLPDRVVVFTLQERTTLFIECKRPGEPLRKLQAKTIEAMRYAGAYVRVYRGEPVESLEDLMNLPME
jgi:hypothetical protein